MTDSLTRNLDFCRTLVLSMSGVSSMAALVLFNLLQIPAVYAQATAGNAKQDIADTWHGTLHAGRDLRTVVKI